MLNAEMNAGTKRCVETFERLSRGRWQTGLAALYAYEAQQPAVAKTKIEGLKIEVRPSIRMKPGFLPGSRGR